MNKLDDLKRRVIGDIQSSIEDPKEQFSFERLSTGESEISHRDCIQLEIESVKLERAL